MITFKRKKHELTDKMLRSITFADSEQYVIDETKLNAGELKKMKEFLNDKGLIE